MKDLLKIAQVFETVFGTNELDNYWCFQKFLNSRKLTHGSEVSKKFKENSTKILTIFSIPKIIFCKILL